MSPPERESRPGGEADSRATNDATEYTRQVRCRRAASYRLPVLDSGRADPWRYEPPTAKYAEAAEHLLELGLTPAPNREALQAMRRRGGKHYRAAKLITERWGGAA